MSIQLSKIACIDAPARTESMIAEMCRTLSEDPPGNTQEEDLRGCAPLRDEGERAEANAILRARRGGGGSRGSHW